MLSGAEHKGVRDFLADVTAFANTDSGDIVIGVREDKNGVAAEIVGIEKDGLDEGLRRVDDQLRSCVDSRPQFRAREIPLDGGRVVLVMRVAASMIAPHRVAFEKSSRFSRAASATFISRRSRQAAGRTCPFASVRERLEYTPDGIKGYDAIVGRAEPHTHVMLRGVDDRGENLIIAREYIAHGFRARAAELATIDLGPRTDREIENRLRHDVEQERLTAIDRRLVRRMDDERTVTAASNDPFQQSVAVGRLRKLGTMGLAENLGHGRWRLADGIEDTLRRMGERGDIIRTMQRELAARKLDRAGVDRRIHDRPTEEIVGRVIHRGFSDEHRDRHCLIVDGIDGRVHYLDIGRGDLSEPTPEESIVRITPRSAAVRDVDRTVAAVAEVNGGRYSVDAHLRHDASATQGFAEAHVRRLEAMRRAGIGVERDAEASWSIPADHLDRAAAYEARGLRYRPVEIETVSTLPIAQLEGADAATWLDREIGATTPMPVRDAGFGREVRSALDARRQWLVGRDLADVDGGKVRLRANAIMLLQRRELLGAGERLAEELGKPFVEARVGDPVEGRLARRVDLAGGRFALVEQSREFTLVPWRSVLERQIGSKVSGLMRSDGVNWRFGRGRDGPTIS